MTLNLKFLLILAVIFVVGLFIIKSFIKSTAKQEMIFSEDSEDSYMQDVTIEHFQDGKRTTLYLKKLIIKK